MKIVSLHIGYGFQIAGAFEKLKIKRGDQT
jgi:hypothetical protein